MLPAAPVPVANYQGVWTGTDLLIHASNWKTGHGSIDAAYNPATNSWRRLSSSPYPVRSIEGGTQVVWDGTEMLTFGVMNAAYDPATNTWRALTAPPLAGPSVVVWTGTRVLMWGGGCCDDASAAGAAYDPARDVWRALPAAPLSGRRTDGVWTGTEMIIVGGQAHGESFFADAAAYNPTTGSWRKLPPMPSPRFDTTLAWTGSEVVAVGGDRSFGSVPYADALAYNLATNRWRHLPPMEVGRTSHTAVWTGHHLIVWGGRTRTVTGTNFNAPPHGLVYDPATDVWSALPKAPARGRTGAIAVWTGSSLIVWGGQGIREPFPDYVDGAVYEP